MPISKNFQKVVDRKMFRYFGKCKNWDLILNFILITKTGKFQKIKFQIFLIFLKNGKLWCTFLTCFESPRKALQDPKILWAKVQKQRSFGRSNFKNYPVFFRN